MTPNRKERLYEVVASWTPEEASQYLEIAQKWAERVALVRDVDDTNVIDELTSHALTDVIPDAVARYRQKGIDTVTEKGYVVGACKRALATDLKELLEERVWIPSRRDAEANGRIASYDDLDAGVRLTKHRDRIGTPDRRPADRAPEDAFPIYRMLCREVDDKVLSLPPVKLGDADRIDPDTNQEFHYVWDWQGEPVHFDAETTRRMIEFDQACDAHVGFHDDELLIECLAGGVVDEAEAFVDDDLVVQKYPDGEKQYVIAELMGVGKNDVTSRKNQIADRFEASIRC